MEQPASPRRRRFWRFRLRTLVLVIVLIALALAWKVNQVKNQKYLVDVVRQLKGSIYFDYQTTQAGLDLDATLDQPEWLRNTFGEDYFRHATMVMLQTPECTDEHVGAIAKVKSLEFVFLDNSKVTAECLQRLSGLRKLRHLQLMNTRTGDAGLAGLPFRNLEKLYLSNTRITDAGLAHIGRFRELRSLTVSNQDNPTAISDAGLEYLSNLRALEELKISGRITGAGLQIVSTLENLRELEIYGEFTDDDLAPLAGLSNLQSLMVGGDQVQLSGLSELSTLEKLETLQILVPAEGREAAALLSLEPLPKLKTVWWYCGSGELPALEALEGHFKTVTIVVENDRRQQRMLIGGRVN